MTEGLCKVSLRNRVILVLNSEKPVWYVVEQKIQRSEQNVGTHVALTSRLPLIFSC